MFYFLSSSLVLRFFFQGDGWSHWFSLVCLTLPKKKLKASLCSFSEDLEFLVETQKNVGDTYFPHEAGEICYQSACGFNNFTVEGPKASWWAYVFFRGSMICRWWNS